MTTTKRRELEDLGKFVQSRIGGELIMGDGTIPDFTLRIKKVTDEREFVGGIETFYHLRGYQQPQPNELHFTKGHQRRSICLAIEGPNAYVAICNPDA